MQIKTPAANATSTETEETATDPLATATAEGPPADGDAAILPVIDPTAPVADKGDDESANDDEDAPDPLTAITAGVAPTPPPAAETPPQGQTDDAAGDEAIKVDAPAAAAPAPTGGQVADASAAPQAQPNGNAAPGDKPAPANAPTPQPHHTAPAHGAPSSGATPQAGTAPGPDAAHTHEGADLAADFDQALDATTDAIQLRSGGRSQGSAAQASLDSLLTAARHQPGDGQQAVTPAAGAADTGSLPPTSTPGRAGCNASSPGSGRRGGGDHRPTGFGGRQALRNPARAA